MLVAGVEVALWSSLFAVIGLTEIAGFQKESYLSYMLWGAFFSRITTNWMYEMRMITEIDTGAINSLLVRPIYYFEYYLSQFMGYKLSTSVLSLIIPVAITICLGQSDTLLRFPLALLLGVYFLIFTFTISFCIATLAFFLNRVHSFTVAKNIIFWVISGELFPLDMVPGVFGKILRLAPFSAGVFVPVGYIVGRLSIADVFQSFISITYGIILFAGLGYFLWRTGRQHYSGTGA